MFGFIFLKCCVDGHQVLKGCVNVHQVVQVDRLSLTLELHLCRPFMPHYLILDALDLFHIVSFFFNCACASKHHISVCSVFYWFHPCGVAVDIMDDCVVLVLPTGSVWNFSRLIFVHVLFHVVCCY